MKKTQNQHQRKTVHDAVTRTLLCAGMAAFLFASCKRDVEAPPNSSQSQPTALTKAKFRVETFPIDSTKKVTSKTGYYRGVNVRYQAFDGKALIGGDVLVNEKEILSATQLQSASAGTANTAKEWPDNFVFYQIDPGADFWARLMIQDAVDHWEANTNLRFVNSYSTNYIHIKTNDSGRAYSNSVGMNGGQQLISFDPFQFTTGSVIHEIGHAVGLWHEHQRQDRNNFVTVHFNNIRPDVIDNFFQYPEGYESLDGLDFGSIMMYPSDAFALDPNEPTITLTDGVTTFGAQRFALSPQDISTIILSKYPKKGPGVGDGHEGAGMAAGLINNNNIPDLILFANDAPAGPNLFKYRVAFDVDAMGRPAAYSNMFVFSGVGDHQDGAGCTLADLNGNGRPDLIMMGDDDPAGQNNFHYKVAFDLDVNGQPIWVTTTKVLSSTGHFNEDAGVAVAQVDNNPLPDLIFMGNDAPSGANQFRYRIAFNVNSNGDYASLSGVFSVAGVGDHQDGSDIAVADINGNGRPDLFFLGDDNPAARNQFRYRVAFDIGTNGAPGAVSGIFARWSPGHYAEGAGATFADVDGNGAPDLFVMMNDAPAGPNQFKFYCGLNLNANGFTENWR